MVGFYGSGWKWRIWNGQSKSGKMFLGGSRMNAALGLPNTAEIDLETMPPRWKWTRRQYYDLAEKGFFAGKRVELIEGEIVYPLKPIRCGKREPEPDLAVIPGGPADYTDHPTVTLLIVEISDSTFSYDTKVKSLVFAKAGNPEYWVLGSKRSRLIVFREPSKKGYKLQAILNRTDSVRALAAPKVPIRIADMLP